MRPRILTTLLLLAPPFACTSDRGGGAPADAADDATDVSADSADSEETGSDCAYRTTHLIPGPCEAGHDAALEAKARRYDRTWRIFNAGGIDLNTDVGVAADHTEDRALIEDFIQNHDGWEAEFEAFAGRPGTELLTGRNKVAGLYAGVGIVADAYRYGVLRDQGYETGEVDVAREHLLRSLDALHLAVAITGVEGVIARGLGRKSWGWGTVTTPLFDEDGDPLPPVKNNGEWREDNSPGGQFPDYIWEDSVSRDQLVGWVAGFGAACEVVADDSSIPSDVVERLRADAKALGHALMVVRESGYDLEVPDADGRTTLHGWLNEHNIDGAIYLPGIENGFHAVMALGIVAAYAYCSQDPELETYLYDELITARQLPRIVKEHIPELNDLGPGSNFSNYNMSFMGFWLAMRYIDDAEARATLQEALHTGLYDRPGRDFQPADIHYSFYDFTFAAGMADASAFGPAAEEPDVTAMNSGLDTLKKFKEPPYWDSSVINCPVLEQFECKQQYSEKQSCTWDDSLLAEPCIASDGVTELIPTGCQAWKCSESVAEALPWELQRPSNYHWRSPPHEPNGGGDGSGLLPGVDFRFAYWIGRWSRSTK